MTKNINEKNMVANNIMADSMKEESMMADNMKEEITMKRMITGNTLSLKEELEYFMRSLTEIAQQISTATTEETVDVAINRLDNIMDVMLNTPILNLNNCRGLPEDIKGSISAVKLHDLTRSTLCELLKKLLQALEELLAEEKKKESAVKLKNLFLQLAEHAEEVAEIIDLSIL